MLVFSEIITSGSVAASNGYNNSHRYDIISSVIIYGVSSKEYSVSGIKLSSSVITK